MEANKVIEISQETIDFLENSNITPDRNRGEGEFSIPMYYENTVRELLERYKKELEEKSIRE